VREKYAAAGVDVSAKDRFIERIKPAIETTRDARVLGGIGHFAGCFSAAELKDYDDPVLVACGDGVGTKLKLATRAGPSGLRAVGIDLVAMSVNDLVACGAKPLFFIDYFASAELDIDQAAAFVEGVADGCRQAGCALLGGETAQMPGLYTPPDFDAAGFVTGVVERAALLGPDKAEAGLTLIGLASSGLHSNGFSLVRKHFSEPDDELLAPTRIYSRAVLGLRDQIGAALRAVANITGGGLYENIPRMLPATLRARVRHGSWLIPPVIERVRSAAELSLEELYAIFNGGLGMVLAVESAAATEALTALNELGETAVEIGALEARPEGGAGLIIDGLG